MLPRLLCLACLFLSSCSEVGQSPADASRIDRAAALAPVPAEQDRPGQKEQAPVAAKPAAPERPSAPLEENESLKEARRNLGAAGFDVWASVSMAVEFGRLPEEDEKDKKESREERMRAAKESVQKAINDEAIPQQIKDLLMNQWVTVKAMNDHLGGVASAEVRSLGGDRTAKQEWLRKARELVEEYERRSEQMTLLLPKDSAKAAE